MASWPTVPWEYETSLHEEKKKERKKKKGKERDVAKQTYKNAAVSRAFDIGYPLSRSIRASVKLSNLNKNNFNTLIDVLLHLASNLPLLQLQLMHELLRFLKQSFVFLFSELESSEERSQSMLDLVSIKAAKLIDGVLLHSSRFDTQTRASPRRNEKTFTAVVIVSHAIFRKHNAVNDRRAESSLR